MTSLKLYYKKPEKKENSVEKKRIPPLLLIQKYIKNKIPEGRKKKTPNGAPSE